SANFANLKITPSALYELARPSTSNEVRNEIIKRAEAGQLIRTIEAETAKFTPSLTIVEKKGEKPLDPYSYLRKITPSTNAEIIEVAEGAVRQAVKTALLDIKSKKKRQKLFEVLGKLLTKMKADRNKPGSDGMKRLRL